MYGLIISFRSFIANINFFFLISITFILSLKKYFLNEFSPREIIIILILNFFFKNSHNLKIEFPAPPSEKFGKKKNYIFSHLIKIYIFEFFIIILTNKIHFKI